MSARESGGRVGSVMAVARHSSGTSRPREPLPCSPFPEPQGHGPRETEVAPEAEDRRFWVGAVEDGGRHLVAAQEALEGGEIARAVRRVAQRAAPDGVETGEDHLGELVDVRLPG